MSRLGFLALLAVGFLAAAGWAFAGEPCCHQCGAGNACRVCRLVCDMKETVKVDYECACEDFCIPGPSHRCRQESCGDCDTPKFTWHPTSARIASRKVLVRKERTVKTPTYRWEVQYLCPQCKHAD